MSFISISQANFTQQVDVAMRRAWIHAMDLGYQTKTGIITTIDGKTGLLKGKALHRELKKAKRDFAKFTDAPLGITPRHS